MARNYVKDLAVVKDLVKEVENLSNIEWDKAWDEVVDASKAITDGLKDSNKYSKENLDLAKQHAKVAQIGINHAKKRGFFGRQMNKFSLARLKIQRSISDVEDDITDDMIEQIDAANEQVSLTQKLGEKLNTIDSAFGGMGSTIKDFVMNPLSGVVALLTTFTSMQQKIGDNFGALGMREFQGDLHDAHQNAVLLGYDFEEAASSMNTLSSNFGIAFDASIGMSESVMQISRATATGVESTAQLMGMFMTIGGHTEDSAKNLMLSAESLAVANGVAPGAVLESIAGSTETFAKFAKDGGENMVLAAIQAKKLGVSLDTVGGIASSLLDFQNSLNKEIEAGLMLGQNINLQRARELALVGDTTGMMDELLDQLGGESRWNELNVLQREALADALGVDLLTMSKLVSKEKEAVTLQGQLAEMEKMNPVPEEAITATAELLNNLKSIGMEMAETMGPTIIKIVEGLVSFVKWLGEGDRAITMLKAAMVLWVAKTGIMIVASLVGMVANLGLMVANMGASTFGVGAIVGLGIMASVITAVMAAIGTVTAMTAFAEGGVVTKPTNALIGEAGPEAVLPLSKFVTMVKEGMSPIHNELKESRKEMHKMREENKGYLGFGGTASREIGRRTAQSFEVLGTKV